MAMSDVTVAISSFCRWGYLEACLETIRQSLPEVQVIVADDSFDDRCANIAGECIRLAPDSGLTCKRNAIVRATQTPYWFCGSDDYDFSTEGFKEGLTEAVGLIDSHPEVDLVGGRVDGNQNESNLEYDAKSDVIRERRLIPDGWTYQKCDLVVDASRAHIYLLEVPWDEDVRPIGGEHANFLAHEEAGKTRIPLPGLNVNTLWLRCGPNVPDPRYGQFRRRAFAVGYTIMLKKEGSRDWVEA